MVFLFFISVFTSAFTYFIFFAPQFKISKVEVFGNHDIDGNKIKDFLFARKNRIFFIGVKSMEREVLAEFPSIKSVNIKKNFPDGISVKVQEREPVAVFCSRQEQCFSIDGEGVIFEKLDSVSEGIAVIRQNFNDQEFYLGKSLVGATDMDTIIKVMDSLRNNFRVGVKEVIVSEYLVFTTSEKWKIYFGQNSDIDFQIEKMNLLLKDDIPPDARKKLQYIYLQYKNRAYYK